MLSTVTLGDLGDLRTGFNAAVSGAAAGSRRRGSSRGFLQLSACSQPSWPRQGTARAARSLLLYGGQELGLQRLIPDQIAGVAPGLFPFFAADAVAGGGTWVGFRLGQPLRVTDNRGQ